MIKNMTLLEQSAFFAKLSNEAYKDLNCITKAYPDYNITYHGNAGADAYTLHNEHDFIIVCRGTEVQQSSDIYADLSISKTHGISGKVHIGFNHYVDKIWADIFSHAIDHAKKNLWVTGHSLGAAMATIISSRFAASPYLATPQAVFTYGCPRVGDRTFVNHYNNLPFEHHRWVNDGDIVTKIPFSPFFYHCGSMHRITSKGELLMHFDRKFTWKRVLNMANVVGWAKMIVNDIKDHSSDNYRELLKQT